MIHPHTELRFISAEIGNGVFAKARIPAGTITWTRCAFDYVFEPEDMVNMPQAYQDVLSTFGYITAEGKYILCWDFGRNMNHSCAPTCLGIGADVEVAVRDIEVGEQVTCEYGSLNLTHSLQCRCGVAGCREEIRGDDVERLGDQWDAAVQKVLPLMKSVPQPLLSFLLDVETLTHIMNGDVTLPSHKSNRLQRKQPAAQTKPASKGLW